MCIKLEINQGYTTMYGQPFIKIWFLPLERGGSSAVGRGRPYHDQQHCYHHAPTVKPEAAAAAVVELLDDEREDARTMLSCT